MELGCALGLPKAWIVDGASLDPVVASVQRTTSLFHWEAVAPSFVQGGAAPSRGSSVSAEPWEDQGVERLGDTPVFQWTPPDLREGGPWYMERVQSLRAAVQTYSVERQATLLADGLADLAVHRMNYTATRPDPTRLRALWWEVPPEH